jgi:predicted permease
MAALRRDLSYAFRRLSRSPGIALAVIISIGLGIAGNATIFSVVSTFLLRPAPVGDPTTLMGLYTTQSGSCCGNNVSWLLYTDLRDQAKSFSGIAAYYPMMPASISGYGEPERVWGELASANFFEVAQVRMTLGRGFTRDEEHLSVMVLSHRLWQRRFGADIAIVGKVVTLSGRPFTVVGVAPPSFRGLDILGSDLWVPLGNQEQLIPKVGDRSRTNTWLELAGRLKPGVTSGQAEAELNGLAQHLAKTYPETPKDLGFRLEQAGTLPPDQKQAVAAFLFALSIVVFLVLCIACANIVNLLLTQAYSRHREMAVRLALGAKRAQLQRQMLLESMLLAIGGGLFGFCLSLWGTSALSAFHLPIPVPIDLTINVDWRVLVYSFVLSIVTGLLFGMPPAWVASRPVLTMALKGEDALASPGRRWNLRSLLVTAQVTASLVLLCATGLFLRSLEKASSIDIGFRSRGILMMNIDPQLHGYTVERTTQFLTELRKRVEAIPGVASVALTDPVPLSMDGRWDDFHTEGRPKDQNAMVDLYMITPGYFETMGIARVAGRDFANDNANAPKVAVVNEAFAQRLFNGENPIGQRVTGTGTTYEIVGVVKNIKSRTLGEELKPVLYRSLAQDIGRDPDFRGVSLLVRSDTDAAALERELRLVIHSLDPALAIFNVETMEEHLRDALFLPRLAGMLFGIFGLTGLVLASVGLYGVMSYSVSRRTREIGIRLALGAQIGSIQRLIIGQGMLLASIAVALGLPIAFVLAKFAGSILYGVRPHDMVTFTVVPLSLIAIAFLACWIPARRALKVDPQTALRCE